MMREAHTRDLVATHVDLKLLEVSEGAVVDEPGAM